MDPAACEASVRCARIPSTTLRIRCFTSFSPFHVRIRSRPCLVRHGGSLAIPATRALVTLLSHIVTSGARLILTGKGRGRGQTAVPRTFVLASFARTSPSSSSATERSPNSASAQVAVSRTSVLLSRRTAARNPSDAVRDSMLPNAHAILSRTAGSRSCRSAMTSSSTEASASRWPSAHATVRRADAPTHRRHVILTKNAHECGHDTRRVEMADRGRRCLSHDRLRIAEHREQGARGPTIVNATQRPRGIRTHRAGCVAQCPHQRFGGALGGSESSAMISATVDSPRRWRMSITWRSRLVRSSEGKGLAMNPLPRESKPPKAIRDGVLIFQLC